MASASPATPLILCGRPYAVERAKLSFQRAARRPSRKDDDVGGAFMLSLHVDDDSGNDASPLDANRLAFGRWSGHRIRVEWSASWHRYRDPAGTLVFKGDVVFAG